jgi:hypothetical protein
MKTKAYDSTGRRARAVIAGAVATVLLAGGTTAGATGDRSVFVSGNSTYSDCGIQGSDLALAMTGDLEGCWSIFVEGFECKALGDFDLYFERGREVFVGSLRGKQGRFATDYTLEAAMARGFCDSFDFALEVAGGCSHKIHGRSGVFEGARGLIKFLDVITGVTGDPVTGAYSAGTGGNNFLYYGRINLDRG